MSRFKSLILLVFGFVLLGMPGLSRAAVLIGGNQVPIPKGGTDPHGFTLLSNFDFGKNSELPGTYTYNATTKELVIANTKNPRKEKLVFLTVALEQGEGAPQGQGAMFDDKKFHWPALTASEPAATSMDLKAVSVFTVDNAKTFQMVWNIFPQPASETISFAGFDVKTISTLTVETRCYFCVRLKLPDPEAFGPGAAGEFATCPEPATWALMIGGFAMAGAALRRRRVVAA